METNDSVDFAQHVYRKTPCPNNTLDDKYHALENQIYDRRDTRAHCEI